FCLLYSLAPKRLFSSRKDNEMRPALVLLLCFIIMSSLMPVTELAQNQTAKPPESVYLLKPEHIFDGESAQLHDGWVVLVHGEKIEAIGPPNEIKAPADAKTIDLPGLTLMPGLIEAHSHILLHPYSETVERSGRPRSFEPAGRAGHQSSAQ